MKLLRNIGLILVCVTMLTGCWDRMEVNDLAFVTATGFDKVKENQFRVAIQIPLPSAMGGAGSSGGGGGTGGAQPFYVDSALGRNVREANDNLQSRMSRKAYFAHRRVLIFGEKVARSGFKRSLDVIVEQPQSRLSTYVLIATGEAIEVLTSSPHLEKLPAEAIRELSKYGFNKDVREVLNDISRPGKDPVIPIVENLTTKNDKGKDKRKEVAISKLAILKDDQFKFATNKQETLGVFWLLENMNRRGYTIPVKENREINVGIILSTVKPKIQQKNNLPSFTLEISAAGTVMQNEANLELNDPKNYKAVTDSMEAKIKQEVEAILAHSMAEGIDVYGLGWYLSRKKSRLWEEKWAKDWDNIIKNIEVNVKVKAEIDESINSALKIKE